MALPHLPSLSAFSHAPLWAWVAVGLTCLFVAMRIRLLRSLVSLGLIVAMIALAGMAIEQPDKLRPYIDRISGIAEHDDQQIVGSEVRIRLSPDGHFWAHARIGGVERRMLIDSGATITALSPDTAAAAGVRFDRLAGPVVLNTANGSTLARRARIDDLRLGAIAARQLAVVVSPGFGDTDVLGMNFLSRLKSWRVEDGVLVLTPHHPVKAGVVADRRTTETSS